MSSGWLPGSFAKLEISGLKDKLSFPKFGLKKPKGISDDLIVEEVEQEAVVLVVPYTLKEHDSFVECCPEQVSVNRYFFEMKVAYGPHEALRDKRGRSSRTSASSTKVSDEPASKKSKKAILEASGSRITKVVSTKVSRMFEAIAGGDQAARGTSRKPPRALGSKIFVSKAEELKRKGIYPSGYSFPIAKEDMGSETFMKELHAMEWSVP